MCVSTESGVRGDVWPKTRQFRFSMLGEGKLYKKIHEENNFPSHSLWKATLVCMYGMRRWWRYVQRISLPAAAASAEEHFGVAFMSWAGAVALCFLLYET